MHPQISALVNSGVVVTCGEFVRDYGAGGVRPVEMDEAYIIAELSRECGLLDEEEAFWEQVDEIELSLGETALSLQRKLLEEEAFLRSMDQWMSNSETDLLEEECILDTTNPGYKMIGKTFCSFLWYY